MNTAATIDDQRDRDRERHGEMHLVRRDGDRRAQEQHPANRQVAADAFLDRRWIRMHS
jgi:hypothetical protein